MHASSILYRIYNIEIVQMIELLQQEIKTTSSTCNQQQQLYHKKAVMASKYERTYLRYIDDDQSRLNEQLTIQQQADRTHQDKMLLQQSLRQLQLKLKMTQLQKYQLLSKCQRHQTKMERLRQQQQKNKCQSKQLSNQRSLLKRQIAQNEAHNIKLCAENEQLVKRCELQLEQVGQKSVDNKNDRLIQKIKQGLSRNIKSVQTMEGQNNTQIQYYKQNKDTKNMQNRQKIIELELQLKRTKYASEMVKQLIQAEKYVEIALTMKEQFVNKIQQFQQTFLKNGQQNQLKDELVGAKQQNNLLRQKLYKHQSIKEQMVELYQNLSLKLNNLKEQETKSLNKMTLNSSRFQKKLDYRRHFLKQRQNILDRYNKYLQ